MSFCLEDQKPQLPEPPSPLLGLFFLGTFEQKTTAEECKRGWRGTGVRSCRKQISSGNTAKEAMLLACDAKIAKDKQDLLELSGTWTQAALQSRSRQLGEVSAA